ncbi:MAG TPA: transcription termination factor Rho [Opitutaceae bacterium]|nr:transcription termination factor Rho [Opitutaceae bacterium]
MESSLYPGDDQPPAESGSPSAPEQSGADDSAAKKPVRRRSRFYRTKAATVVTPAPEPRSQPASAPPPEPPPTAARVESREAATPSPEPAAAPQLPPGDASSAGRETNEAERADSGEGGEQGGGEQGGGEQGGGYQPHGGGYDPYFFKKGKRHKRKRGKHWLSGPPGGNQYPPQPPPPNFAPVFGDLPDPARFTDLTALDALAADLASGGGAPINLDELYGLGLADLTAAARGLGAVVDGAPNRKELLAAIFRQAGATKRPVADHGWLDLTDRGHGFLVHKAVNYRLYPEDPYVPESLIKRYGLKRGHELAVRVRAPEGEERCPAVLKIHEVMGMKPEDISKITPFEELVPYYPLKRILLEVPEQTDVSMRAVDILTPVGFGQRGLIVAPPRTGKTVLLHNMANAISTNSPETCLIILLVDERPEEVTDFRRHTRGEVVSSTFDETPQSHTHAAEMVIEKARRLVELGRHVVILLDSITRLARAYNALASNSGKIMTGGMEATALQKPKRFFGSARNIEGGGSLTIMGTALIDTGSKMDEVIFEEFKGTGNMELHLDRDLVNKRIFPSLNMERSGTRKEELIYHPDELLRIYSLRRAMQGIPPVEAMEMLISRLKKTKSNAEFLLSLNR